MKLTLTEIVEYLKIEMPTPIEGIVTSVEFDSRLVTKGSLFVPLAGARDGHEFVQAAIEKGAVATLWSRPVTEAPEGIIVLPVADVKVAFQQLAVYYLEKIAPKVVAITGSNGKTTTKDMTEAVLAQQYQTYKTQGNYNNDLGMPYTILHMPESTEILILEMGMNHFDEIAFLSKLAKPDAAAITMIGEAHIENLGSRAGIAQAKMEIVSGLAADGLLLVPADEPLLTPMIAELAQNVATFGLGQGTIQGQVESESKNETVFTVDGVRFTIPVLGSYNVTNALIAYGLGRHFNLPVEKIVTGLATFQLTKNRTEWKKAANGADLLSDVYNANPTAMGLVLDSFGHLPVEGRRVAVLADMLELGADSQQMHAQMASHIGASYDCLFLYGEQMQALRDVLATTDLEVHHFGTVQKADLVAALTAFIQPKDSVLFKGSNGMGLAAVVDALMK